MRMNKRIASLVLALMMILSSFTTVFAMDLDLFNPVTDTTHSFNSFVDSPAVFEDVSSNVGDYLIEFEGNYYKVSEVSAKLLAGAANFEEAIEDLTPVDIEVPEEPEKPWEIRFSTTAPEDTIDADGDDNTTLIIELIDVVTGEVVPANGIVVQLFTSHGSLASTGRSARVTLQNGRNTIKLNSEFSATPIAAEITIKLVEATQEQKDKIGQHEFVKYVFFKPFDAEDVTAPPIMVAAESNQADRVTLYFDKEVSLADFILNNLEDNVPYNIYFYQDFNYAEAAGLLPVEGNPKALVAVLEEGDVLDDNAWVEVNLDQNTDYGWIYNEANFILTDARQPELVEVRTVGDSLKLLELEFSESIYQVIEVIIDGDTVPVNVWTIGTFVPGYFDDGEYIPSVDERHLVTVELEDDAWFTAGWHSVTVRGAWDFAAASDLNNRSTTQTLDFEIIANTSKPTVNIVVESPEQFRVTAPVGMAIDAPLGLVYGTDWMIQYKDTSANPAVWETVTTGVVSEVEAYKEYVIETTMDWTEYFGTATSEINYYNREFRLFVKKDVLVNRANGFKNDEISKSLNYVGSPMNIEDVVSPKKVEVLKVDDYVFDIEMSEPVKGRGIDQGPASENLDTPSQQQTAGAGTPIIVVEFIGTDKDGDKVTYNGALLGYGDENGADKIVTVEAPSTLQDLVDNDGYSGVWTLNVKNITDDIGNAAETVTHTFIIEKSVDPVDEVEFWVEEVVTSGSAIVVTYTDLIKTYGDEENAVKLSNYSINNQELPKGTIIKVDQSSAVYNDDNTKIIGYKGIIINIPLGTFSQYNTIEIAKTLVSLNGNEFLGFEGYPAGSRYQETIPFSADGGDLP